ncbi:MAG: diacylglycerol kinase family lipid kinase [Marinilabiliales bacterium]|nr:diacylglycerol kinase family lipid kinase [Marinilabiliales bacterium]
MSQLETTEWQVILNPHAGGGKGSHDGKKIERLLQQAGLPYHLSVSSYAGHAVELARELVQKGCHHFIVAGGDGTLNEVVNGIFLADPGHLDQITLGMIPVGTGNDWIKTFGIPDHYAQSIEIIRAGKSVKQDVGEILCTLGEKSTLRYFVNIAGFGFDALVAKNANELKSKGISGIRVYIQSLLSGYFHYHSRKLRFTIDGILHEVNLFSASIGIGKFNGGGMMQVPQAHPLKGSFHITIIRKIGIWGIVTNFKGLYSGEFIRDKRVSTHVGKEVQLQAEYPIQGEADGENLGLGHFTLKILPQRLNVIYGSDRFLGSE